MPGTSSICTPRPPSALSSRPRPFISTERRLRPRFGTPPAKSGSGRSSPPTTAAPLAFSSSTILPAAPPSTVFLAGSKNLTVKPRTLQREEGSIRKSTEASLEFCRCIESISHSDTTVARMLVGNKCDLNNIRAVSVEEGRSIAEAEGMFFMETSALDSTNVKQAFEIVIREIYNNVSRKVLNSDSYKAELSVNRVRLGHNNSNGFDDDALKPNKNKGYSCCSR
ncbi:unnamed protein product [Cuscuta europaea]|uniref:Uncharacterized protein n=1 Tax=Cuscuta europaea TaxID=41803 RepID=A0A9P0ZJP9_CUSEU|nr:unnamed protein product [Cuscuta europaea]